MGSDGNMHFHNTPSNRNFVLLVIVLAATVILSAVIIFNQFVIIDNQEEIIYDESPLLNTTFISIDNISDI